MLTVNSVIGFPGEDVNFFGYVDSNGYYDFTGGENPGFRRRAAHQRPVHVHRRTGPTARFDVQSQRELCCLPAAISGLVTTDGEGNFTATATAVGNVLDGPSLDFVRHDRQRRVLRSEGQGRHRPRSLGSLPAHFELSSANGLTFSDSFELFNVFSGTVTGSSARTAPAATWPPPTRRERFSDRVWNSREASIPPGPST